MPERLQNALIKWVQGQFRLYNYSKFYTFTISPHQRYVERMVLEDGVRQIFRSYKSVIGVRYIMETSKLGKLHVHGILCARDNSKFVKLRRHPTCNYMINPYSPGNEWIVYMGKGNPQKLYGYYKNQTVQGSFSTSVNVYERSLY